MRRTFVKPCRKLNSCVQDIDFANVTTPKTPQKNAAVMLCFAKRCRRFKGRKTDRNHPALFSPWRAFTWFTCHSAYLSVIKRRRGPPPAASVAVLLLAGLLCFAPQQRRGGDALCNRWRVPVIHRGSEGKMEKGATTVTHAW